MKAFPITKQLNHHHVILNQNIMDAPEQNKETFATKFRFKTLNTDKKQELLIGKDKASTQRATKSIIGQFLAYLELKHLPKVEDLDLNKLSQVLRDYHSSLQPQKKSEYSV